MLPLLLLLLSPSPSLSLCSFLSCRWLEGVDDNDESTEGFNDAPCDNNKQFLCRFEIEREEVVPQPQPQPSEDQISSIFTKEVYIPLASICLLGIFVAVFLLKREMKAAAKLKQLFLRIEL